MSNTVDAIATHACFLYPISDHRWHQLAAGVLACLVLHSVAGLRRACPPHLYILPVIYLGTAPFSSSHALNSSLAESDDRNAEAVPNISEAQARSEQGISLAFQKERIHEITGCCS